jgi:hypothetical protein
VEKPILCNIFPIRSVPPQKESLSALMTSERIFFVEGREMKRMQFCRADGLAKMRLLEFVAHNTSCILQE